MPTMGWFKRIEPVEPENCASPNEKMPPSLATIQYPRPDGVAAIPTTGLLRRMPPVEPENGASPNEKIPPSEATTHAPSPDAVDARPCAVVWTPIEGTSPMAYAPP